MNLQTGRKYCMDTENEKKATVQMPYNEKKVFVFWELNGDQVRVQKNQ